MLFAIPTSVGPTITASFINGELAPKSVQPGSEKEIFDRNLKDCDFEADNDCSD